MFKSALSTYGASVALHVALLGGLAAWTSVSRLPTLHLRSGGTTTIEGSFLATEASFSATPIVIQPASQVSDQQSATITSFPVPAVALVQRTGESLPVAPLRPELPEPPPPAEVPATASAMERQLPSADQAIAEVPPSTAGAASTANIPRATAVAGTYISTEVSLPSGSASGAGAVDKLPSKFGTNRPPPYPAAALQRREQGVVLLEVHVTANGRVDSLRIVESSGFALLDQAALDAVIDWRFEPAQLGGRPVAASVNVPVRFAIRS